MFRKLPGNAILVGLFATWLASQVAAQSPSSASPESAISQPGAAPAASNGGGTEPPSWLARDPLTGRVFQQQLITQSVPTTQWEVRPVTTTVYEPQQVVTNVTSQHVTYTPTTQYVMQPRLRGWWNPMRQPVQAYEFVPVTSWQPQMQTVQQPVATTQWVPKQQVVYVPTAVQRLQTQQQIVSRELPQPNGGFQPNGYGGAGYSASPMMANQPQPLINIPILAQQRILPWPSGAPTNALRSFVNNGLRPINNVVPPTYSAPLQTASTAGNQAARDPLQAGMSATILR